MKPNDAEMEMLLDCRGGTACNCTSGLGMLEHFELMRSVFLTLRQENSALRSKTEECEKLKGELAEIKEGHHNDCVYIEIVARVQKENREALADLEKAREETRRWRGACNTPTTSMAYFDATKRAESAEAEIAAMRERVRELVIFQEKLIAYDNDHRKRIISLEATEKVLSEALKFSHDRICNALREGNELDVHEAERCLKSIEKALSRSGEKGAEGKP